MFMAAAGSTSDSRIIILGAVGVIAGAFIGYIGVWTSTRSQRKIADRAELRRALLEFLDARDAEAASFSGDKHLERRIAELRKKSRDSSEDAELEILLKKQADADLSSAGARVLRAINAVRMEAPEDTSMCAVLVSNADYEDDWLMIKSRMLFDVLTRRDLASGPRRWRAAREARRRKKENWYLEGKAEQESWEARIMQEHLDGTPATKRPLPYG